MTVDSNPISGLTESQRRCLGLIRRLGACTRDDIAEHLGWQPATISRTVGPLLENSWIVSRSVASTREGERRRAHLELLPATACAIGVEINFRQTRTAIIDLQGNVLHATEPIDHEALKPQETIKQLVKTLRATMKAHKKLPILGIGVSFAGSLPDPNRAAFCFPGSNTWDEFPLQQTLQAAGDLPVHVHADNVAAVLAEMRYGNARRRENFVYLHMDQGIGLGIVTNGIVHMGARNLAGEFGHTCVIPQGPVCYCGGTGCLESVASSWAILNQVRERLRNGVFSRHLAQKLQEQLTLADVCTSVTNGDLFARDVLESAGDWLGLSLGNVSDLLDPEVIILGGILAEPDPYEPVIQALKESYARKAPFYRSRGVPMITSQLGRNTHLIGAAATVFESVLPAYPAQFPTRKLAN